jgi:hypothetical protein
MKRLLALTVVLGFAVAAPATAQTVSGQINLAGSVAAACSVVAGPPGFTSGAFASTYTFTPMTDGTGQLNAGTFGVATSASAGNPVNVSAQVSCNTGTPNVALAVEPMSQGDAGSAGSSVTGTIDFTGAAVITTTSGTVTFPPVGISTSTAAPGGTATAPKTALTAPLSTTANPNLVIYAYNFATRNGPVLEPGTYNGYVQVTVTPN